MNKQRAMTHISNHKKKAEKENLELDNLNFSDDGRFLCVVSNQGLMMFSEENHFYEIGIKKNLTKKTKQLWLYNHNLEV